MKCKCNVLITKLEARTKRDSNESYILISFLDMETGDVFDVIDKNIEVLKELQPMTKRENFIVNFSNSKYGIRLDIIDYGKQGNF